MEQQVGQVERFLKLGYSQGDIQRVLASLCRDAQTNDILEELIKTCPSPGSVRSSPKLVARGCSAPSTGPGTRTTSTSSLPPMSLGSAPEGDTGAGFRQVVIDGSNVAMSHGNKKVFSCRGLQLAVKWFWDKGLRDIIVFVPLWRKEQPRPDAPMTDQHILHELERRNILVYTPSRCVNGKRVVCYDDRYIVKVAFDSDGVIVSNDNYRDLQTENLRWKKFIEERLLMFTFANDKFLPPDDPLGRNGPTIDTFLRKKPWIQESKQLLCPYGRKCTYGVKCKFYHPERTNQSQLSVADELRAMSRPAADRAPEHRRQIHRRSLSSSPDPSLGARLPGPHSRPEADEAFGSLEGPASGLRDEAPGSDGLSHGYSSGIASFGRSDRDFFSSGLRRGDDAPSVGGHRGPWGPAPPACERSACSCCGYDSRHAPRAANSYLSERRHGERACPSAPPRPCQSLPEGPRGPGGKDRRTLSLQLCTLFPHSVVERIMAAHPQAAEASELIALIDRYDVGHAHF